MNHKSINCNIKLPKHIDPRDPVIKEITTEVVNLSLMMKDSGNTPYRYIRRAMKFLVKGDYDNASNELKFADNFSGIFWKENSADDEAFKVTISVLRLQFIFLIERFRELPPEKDREE